jgi:hypothetical protein
VWVRGIIGKASFCYQKLLGIEKSAAKIDRSKRADQAELKISQENTQRTTAASSRRKGSARAF